SVRSPTDSSPPATTRTRSCTVCPRYALRSTSRGVQSVGRLVWRSITTQSVSSSGSTSTMTMSLAAICPRCQKVRRGERARPSSTGASSSRILVWSRGTVFAAQLGAALWPDRVSSSQVPVARHPVSSSKAVSMGSGCGSSALLVTLIGTGARRVMIPCSVCAPAPAGQPVVRKGVTTTRLFTASPDPEPAPEGPSAAPHQLFVALKPVGPLYTPPVFGEVFPEIQLLWTQLSTTLPA